ncbi:phage tail protein, partial [Akkermansia muciniphila]|uniref:phage tail-collar fiber domain-containing protein n=2 Tax=Akkermansia TaxID=239934 RepID=UPI0020A2C7BB
MVITTAGLELLQDLILEGGTPLTFSGVGVGDGLLEDSDITAKTSLVHEVHRLPIEKIEKQEGGHIRVFARLATDIITTDFYHRELGVFTRYGEQEILFAYGNAGDDYDFIPATGNNASICKTIVTEFTVGSMKAVFLPLDSKDFVTHEAMNAQVEEVITRETRKVLKAIPQVDAAGNMTLAGGLTAAGAINANGGVNIPLAVGAPTDTSAVNRLHAAGLAGVTDIFSQHAYLNTGSITATGTAATTAFIPGQYA